MWLQIIFIVVCFLLATTVKRKQKGERHDSPSRIIPTLDSWTVIKEIFFLITTQRNMPNYEWSYFFGKRWQPIVAMRIPRLPGKTKTFFNGTDLHTCKSVMNSSLWPDRIYENHYMHRSTFNQPLGLLFGCGEHREKSSRLTVKLLHQFEFFKPSKMENFLLFEMAEIEADLAKRIDDAGGMLAFSPHQMFEVGTMNVVCQVLFTKRFSPEDPRVQRMLSTMNTANREFCMGYTPLEVFPWLKYFPQLTFVQSMNVASDEAYRVCQEIIAEKRKLRSSLDDEPKDFTDAFLREVDKNEDKILTDEALLAVLRDMIFAGSDTTNSALEHAILHVTLQKRIQKKVQAEIDEILGCSRTPTYNDRNKMPYTQAVVNEILRVASPVPMTIRANAEPTSVQDCPVEKGSQVAINLYAIHRSEDLWEDPLMFRPERFLNEDGALVNTEKIMPFGAGRRSCVGESVARVTLFLFFVSLIQKFEFDISPDHPAPSLANAKGLSRCPMPYFVQVRKRPLCD